VQSDVFPPRKFKGWRPEQ